MTAITIGDRVAYSNAFLRSTFQYAGLVPFARGKVVAINDLGETKLARVEWDNMPARMVNTRNLVRADRLHLEA